jgi:hypothetical protein
LHSAFGIVHLSMDLVISAAAALVAAAVVYMVMRGDTERRVAGV